MSNNTRRREVNVEARIRDIEANKPSFAEEASRNTSGRSSHGALRDTEVLESWPVMVDNDREAVCVSSTSWTELELWFPNVPSQSAYYKPPLNQTPSQHTTPSSSDEYDPGKQTGSIISNFPESYPGLPYSSNQHGSPARRGHHESEASWQERLLRRRAQNRASQRVFRERRENHTKALQNQVEATTQVYLNLRLSCAQKDDELLRLHSRIQTLRLELETLRTRITRENQTDFGSERFDAFREW